MGNSAAKIIATNCKWARENYYIDTQKYYSLYLFSVVVNSLLSVVTIILNVLTIWIFYKEKKLRYAKDVLLCALATTDLYAGFVSTPSLVAESILQVHNKATCKVYLTGYIIRLVGFSLTYSATLLISADRYLAIFHPFRYETRSDDTVFITKILVSTLLSTIITSILSLFTPQSELVTIMAVGVMIGFIPFSFWVHLKALFISRRIQRQIDGLRVGNENMSQSNQVRKEVRAAKSTAIILCCICLCYLPQATAAILRNTYPNIPTFRAAMLITSAFVMLNSALNPLIYVWQMQWFRMALFKTVNINQSGRETESSNDHLTTPRHFSKERNHDTVKE